MDKPTVSAVFRIPLPHDGYGEIRAGMLNGGCMPFPPGCVVWLECGTGWWCRGSELALIAASLDGVERVSVTGTDLRIGAARGLDGVVTGIGQIAACLAELLGAPRLFDVA
jgi:hypothetical protein